MAIERTIPRMKVVSATTKNRIKFTQWNESFRVALISGSNKIGPGPLSSAEIESFVFASNIGCMVLNGKSYEK